MNRHHKWFRKERHKNKLEHEVDAHRTYYSNVYFTTEEPDPRDIREHTDDIYWAAGIRNVSIEEALDRYIEDERKWGNGRFIYCKRPEVPYSIRYYYKKSKRSRHQKDLKKRTNRRVRQRWRQYGEEYQNN